MHISSELKGALSTPLQANRADLRAREQRGVELIPNNQSKHKFGADDGGDLRAGCLMEAPTRMHAELSAPKAVMPTPDLSLFDNSWYSSGRTRLAEALWFFLGLPVLRCRLIPFSFVRAFVLRLFGAKVAAGVVLKPGIRVKHPWLLSVGANSWIGEEVWIDNLVPVRIGSNACVSQGAYLCTGNHNWADPAFGLIVEPIALGDGSWVGARAMICPGANLGECSVASAGSVVTKCIPPFEVHAGNPSKLVRHRCVGVSAPAQ